MFDGRTLGARNGVLALVGLIVPPLIAFAFGNPASRVLLPETVMFSLAVLLTVVGGLVPGLITIVSATASLWVVSLPSSLGFEFRQNDDRFGVIASGLIGVALIVLVDRLRDRANHSAVALARAEVETTAQRRSLEVMQRALQPATVPLVAGISVASYYETGGEFEPVGGDWFVYVPLSLNRLGFAIGDVSGHGLSAVAAMAEYRYALRTLASQFDDPSTVLDLLQKLAVRYPNEQFTSCFYGVIDSTDGSWVFANAGHLPPVLVRDGHAEVIDDALGPVISVAGGGRDGSARRQLKPGDALIFYTDGLIERRTQSIDRGIERLRIEAAQVSDDLQSTCEYLARTLTAGTDVADDVAVVIVRYDDVG